MRRGDVSSDEMAELAREYLDVRDQRDEKLAEWLHEIQAAVDRGEISFEAAELAVEFEAADEEEAYQRTLERGFMFPDWRPDTLGAGILDRPEEEP